MFCMYAFDMTVPSQLLILRVNFVIVGILKLINYSLHIFKSRKTSDVQEYVIWL